MNIYYYAIKYTDTGCYILSLAAKLSEIYFKNLSILCASGSLYISFIRGFSYLADVLNGDVSISSSIYYSSAL